MPNTNASFSPRMRSDELKTQIGKLEQLDHRTAVQPTLMGFDAETEELLVRLYGGSHKYVEAYKYATVGEAEALVNLPESAQEPNRRPTATSGTTWDPHGNARYGSQRSIGADRRRPRRPSTPIALSNNLRS